MSLKPVDLDGILAEKRAFLVLRQIFKALLALVALKLDNSSVLRIFDEDAIAGCRRRG